MGIVKINNILSWEELDFIKNLIENSEFEIDKDLGRMRISRTLNDKFSKDILDKLYEIANQSTDIPLTMSHAICVEYSAKYGQPNLPPHFDGDTNDLIINMQLESNTSWDIGLNLNTYTLEDNSALVFNGNTEVHWRVHKEFKGNEYIRMMFVRFYNSKNISDYSHLSQYWPSHDIFKEANLLRDSIKYSI
jgi:hypothetical protein